VGRHGPHRRRIRYPLTQRKHADPAHDPAPYRILEELDPGGPPHQTLLDRIPHQKWIHTGGVIGDNEHPALGRNLFDPDNAIGPNPEAQQQVAKQTDDAVDEDALLLRPALASPLLARRRPVSHITAYAALLLDVTVYMAIRPSKSMAPVGPGLPSGAGSAVTVVAV